jgi:hypothetical protein
MGSGLCKTEKVVDEKMDAHRRIELELKKDRVEEKKLVKILLLGR